MVIINSTKDIEGAKQWVFITLAVNGDSIEYTTVQPWNTDVPVLSGQDLVDWCNTQEDRYKFDIFKDMYPDHPNIQDLEAMEQWIADGCIIPAVLDEDDNEVEPERVAEKVEWTNKHPVEQDLFDRKKASKETLAALDKAGTIPQLKTVLRRMLIK